MTQRKRITPMVPWDGTEFRDALAGPGSDTRAWCSMGLVGFNDGDPVVFDVERGVPLVKVILHPSFTKVYCRVAAGAAGAAGDGEGEWAPFVENDEVLVMLPEGSTRAGAVITNRFNNQLYKFPMDSVAGQDPTTNTFAFTRRRTALITEVATSWLVRSAQTGAFINVSKEGVITLKDGENSALQISPDVIGLVGPSTKDKAPEFLLQLDLTNRHFIVQVGDAIMTLSASDATPEVNTISVPGSFSLGTIGNPSLEHVITTEASVSLISAVLDAIATAFALIPPAPTFPGGVPFSTIISALVTAGLAPAISAAGILSPAASTAIQAKFAAAGQKPNTPNGQLAPGIGSPGFLIG